MSTVPSLIGKLRAQLDAAELTDLVAELPDETDESPVRVAFVGAYNAGKSTLIADLTGDLSIKRDAKPETSEVEYYEWPGHGLVLTDIPGWFSGFEEHDDTADAELRRNADLVAFTLTVELGDENNVDALARVLDRLAFADRTLIVVNKANAEDNDRAVILEEVKKRLGGHSSLPIVFTDAQDYFDTISGEFDFSPQDIVSLREDSGIQDLEDALVALAERAVGARHISQAQQARRVAAEAVARLVPDEEEVAGQAVADDLAGTIEACKARLLKVLEAERDRLETDLAALADLSIKAADKDESDEQAALEQMNARWQHITEDCIDRLNDGSTREVEQLGRDTATTLDVLPLAQLSNRVQQDGDRQSKRPGLLQQMLSGLDIKPQHVTDPITREIRKIASGGSDSESYAYELSELARRFQPDGKFKSWGRRKVAKQIEEGAKKADRVTRMGPALIPAFSEGIKWFKQQKADADRRKAADKIRSDFAAEAKTTGEQLAEDFASWMAEAFAPVQERLEALSRPLQAAQAARETIRTGFLSLDSEMETALITLTTSAPPA